MKRLLLILFCFISLAGTLKAVEILIDKNASPDMEKEPKVSVGYVDINALFEEHPMTARFKETMYAEAEKRKKEIADMRKKLSDLEAVAVSTATVIIQMEREASSLKTGFSRVSISSAPLQPSPAASESDIRQNEALIAERKKSLEQLREDIEKQRAGIVEQRKKSKEDLEKLEKDNTEKVMDDLYEIIEEVAIDENLNVILDKSNVLYGKSAKNITEKVRARLQGR